ncbi:MAG: NAD-dependent epimerase/dehydratase family protein [Alphaproteobacteria bacterium]
MQSEYDFEGRAAGPRVLVIGATGFLGKPLVHHLHTRKAQIFAMHRGVTGDPERGEIILCDRSDSERLANLARLERFDVVIDLLAMTVRETLPVIHALSGRIGRYILVSSADVYRNYEGLHRKGSAEAFDLLKYDSPLRTIRYPYKGPDGQSLISHVPADYDKIPIEGAVRAHSGFDWTILRLPIVYGPGDRQRRFSSLIRRMADGRGVLPLERQWASWQASYGYVDNVADAIAQVAMADNAHGLTINLGPESAMSVVGMARALARVTDWHGELLVTEDQAMPAHMAALARNHDFRYFLRMDTGALWNHFDYFDRVALDIGLRETVEDELKRSRPGHLDEDYAAEDRWLSRSGGVTLSG